MSHVILGLLLCAMVARLAQRSRRRRLMLTSDGAIEHAMARSRRAVRDALGRAHAVAQEIGLDVVRSDDDELEAGGLLDALPCQLTWSYDVAKPGCITLHLDVRHGVFMGPNAALRMRVEDGAEHVFEVAARDWVTWATLSQLEVRGALLSVFTQLRFEDRPWSLRIDASGLSIAIDISPARVDAEMPRGVLRAVRRLARRLKEFGQVELADAIGTLAALEDEDVAIALAGALVPALRGAAQGALVRAWRAGLSSEAAMVVALDDAAPLTREERDAALATGIVHGAPLEHLERAVGALLERARDTEGDASILEALCAVATESAHALARLRDRWHEPVATPEERGCVRARALARAQEMRARVRVHLVQHARASLDDAMLRELTREALEEATKLGQLLGMFGALPVRSIVPELERVWPRRGEEREAVREALDGVLRSGDIASAARVVSFVGRVGTHDALLDEALGVWAAGGHRGHLEAIHQQTTGAAARRVEAALARSSLEDAYAALRSDECADPQDNARRMLLVAGLSFGHTLADRMEFWDAFEQVWGSTPEAWELYADMLTPGWWARYEVAVPIHAQRAMRRRALGHLLEEPGPLLGASTPVSRARSRAGESVAHWKDDVEFVLEAAHLAPTRAMRSVFRSMAVREDMRRGWLVRLVSVMAATSEPRDFARDLYYFRDAQLKRRPRLVRALRSPQLARDLPLEHLLALTQLDDRLLTEAIFEIVRARHPQDPRAVEAFFRTMLRHSDSSVKLSAIQVLEEVGTLESVEALVGLTQNFFASGATRHYVQRAIESIQQRDGGEARPGGLSVALTGDDRGGLSMVEERGALEVVEE